MALVPLTINYVNPSQYGIWLTLSSIISWFSFFDIGFSQGLRNVVTASLANDNYRKARIYISTTYAVLIIIFSILCAAFFILNFFLDWTIVLNTPPQLAKELSALAMIIFSFFCMQMVLRIINTIVNADQKPALANSIDTIGQLFVLLLIYSLTKLTHGSLINLGLILGGIPQLILLISSILLFSNKYKALSPKIKYINFKYAKDIMIFGGKFFLIQISIIVIFQTNNIIITQIGSPLDVTIFNIAYRYMSVILMVINILISPLWSAFAEASTKKDYIWMQNTLRITNKIFYFIISTVLILVLIANPVYNLWIGNSVEIPMNVTIFTGIYIFLLCIIQIYTQILNGIGKLKIQVLSYSIALFLHIPIAFMLGKVFGIIGVLLSASIFYSIISICSVKQVNLLVNNKATGIWNK